MSLLHVSSVTVTAFLASLVEFVEALTIVLAVGTTRSWRPALLGALAGVVVLGFLVLILGPSLHLIPIRWMQLGVGLLVALFGLKWLGKATLRWAGRLPMHDEEKEFAKQVTLLKQDGATPGLAKKELDWIGLITTFKATLLEGLEVVFIVITAGSVSGRVDLASWGALAALVLVALVGVVVHRPLARVPENTLKWVVGVMLSAFGIFWVGEGMGLSWPGDDAFVFFLALAFACGSYCAVRILRAGSRVVTTAADNG